MGILKSEGINMDNKNVFLKKNKIVMAHDNTKLHKAPFHIGDGTSVGARFTLDDKTTLKYVTVFAPSYGDNVGTLPMYLYKWNETFEKTVAAEPMYRKDMVDFADNVVVCYDVDIDDITNGQYLLLFKDGKDGVGVWRCELLPEDHDDKIKYDFTAFSNGIEDKEYIPFMAFGLVCKDEEKTYAEPVYQGADFKRDGWAFDDIPSYDYGVLSAGVYNCGQGIYLPKYFSAADDSQMICIRETNINEYKSYIRKLSENGYTEEMHNEISSNVYDMYSNGMCRVYCYYTEEYNTARVILDKTSASVDDFSYKYDKKPGETTEIYQYGIRMAHFVNPDPTYLEYINCGMSYVIKLADNSVYVIDGGMFTQYDEAHCEKFISFLHEITKTAKNEKIRVACWSITHGHDDHNSGFAYFMNKYNSELTLERVLFNLPDEFNENKNLEGSCEYNHGAFEWIKAYWPDVIEVKCHTGQKFSIADIDIEVLLTHEDIVDTKTGKSIAAEFNSTGSVFKVYFDGKVFLVPGDMTIQGEKVIVETFEPEVLKCDVLQAPHHYFNYLYVIYPRASAHTILCPQFTVFISKLSCMEQFDKYAVTQCEKIYYGGNETVGVRVENDEIVDFYHDEIVGGRYTGWNFK